MTRLEHIWQRNGLDRAVGVTERSCLLVAWRRVAYDYPELHDSPKYLRAMQLVDDHLLAVLSPEDEERVAQHEAHIRLATGQATGDAQAETPAETPGRPAETEENPAEARDGWGDVGPVDWVLGWMSQCGHDISPELARAVVQLVRERT
jgi:hypothetical protein